MLDDFSGSGLSYLRRDDQGKADGKVASFVESLLRPDNPNAKLVNLTDLEIIVVLYLATTDAQVYLQDELQPLCSAAPGIQTRVLVVYPLPPEVRINRGDDSFLDQILDGYYDDTNETDSTRLGRTDLKYGFAWCGLPLILSHNTPNNSLGILWAKGPKMRPLFPRITRHMDRV